MCERQDVRAAARAADLGADAARVRIVEHRASQVIDPSDQVATTLAAGCGGRLEGDRRHLRADPLDASRGAVDHAVQPHVMDDAGALQVAADRGEAALA